MSRIAAPSGEVITPIRSGYHPDPLWKTGKRLLVSFIEQPLFPKPPLQPLERRLQGPFPDRLDQRGDELVAAARLTVPGSSTASGIPGILLRNLTTLSSADSSFRVK